MRPEIFIHFGYRINLDYYTIQETILLIMMIGLIFKYSKGPIDLFCGKQAYHLM